MKKQAAGPDIHARTLRPEVLRLVFDRNERTERHLARVGSGRRAVDRVTNCRPAAVASNQRVSVSGCAVYKMRRDAPVVLQKAIKGMSEMDAFGIVGKHRLAKSAVKISTMNLEMAGTIF